MILTAIKKVLLYLFEFSNNSWFQTNFRYLIYLSYIFFFITFTGILKFSPSYLHTLQLIINYYIIFILLIRFNPIISKMNVKVNTEFDRKVVFSAAWFMLISSSLFNYVNNYIHIRTEVQK